MNFLSQYESLTLTVGELMERLKDVDPQTPIHFGPQYYFSVSRVKTSGSVVHIDFNQGPGVHYTLTPEHPYRQYVEASGREFVG